MKEESKMKTNEKRKIAYCSNCCQPFLSFTYDDEILCSACENEQDVLMEFDMLPCEDYEEGHFWQQEGCTNEQ